MGGAELVGPADNVGSVAEAVGFSLMPADAAGAAAEGATLAKSTTAVMTGMTMVDFPNVDRILLFLTGSSLDGRDGERVVAACQRRDHTPMPLPPCRIDACLSRSTAVKCLDASAAPVQRRGLRR